MSLSAVQYLRFINLNNRLDLKYDSKNNLNFGGKNYEKKQKRIS
jgi:hypothetical protein